MLVLARKPNQSILVDGVCRITIFKSPCKLGIEGDARVLRGELFPEESTAKSDNPTIHLVDDNADLLRAYQRFLQHFGYNVKTFSHGNEYLKWVRNENDASAVVLDLRLADEDIDGLKILQQLRAWKRNFPVILLTGYGDVDTCRRAFHGGCYTFLQKPVAPEDLAATLKEATEKYRRGELKNSFAPNTLAV